MKKRNPKYTLENKFNFEAQAQFDNNFIFAISSFLPCKEASHNHRSLLTEDDRLNAKGLSAFGTQTQPTSARFNTSELATGSSVQIEDKKLHGAERPSYKHGHQSTRAKRGRNDDRINILAIDENNSV